LRLFGGFWVGEGMARFDLSGASQDFSARFHLSQLLTCSALNGNEADRVRHFDSKESILCHVVRATLHSACLVAPAARSSHRIGG
jgi:hypothetical protein